MKIINSLTVKNLKLNRSRSIVTMIGILLSCALITVVANVAVSVQKTLLQEVILNSGNYIYSSNYASTDTIKKVSANRAVEDVYVEKPIGFGILEEPKHQDRDGIMVEALNLPAWERGFNIELAEGRLPQNNKELVLADNIVGKSKKVYHVGDTITLQLGDRVVENEEGDCAIDAHELLPKDEYKIKNTKEYTYQIVGIMKENHSSVIEAPVFYDFGNAYTLYEGEDISEEQSRNCYLYANFKESEMKRYKEIVAEILDISYELVENYVLGEGASEADCQEYLKSIKEDQIININSQLISRRGIDLSESDGEGITILATVVILIILFVSVFVIRNSFAISITEKNKLYGMLAAVGATSKQIRNNVLFEGLILGCISIPLGLALGYAVTGGLIAVLNLLLGDFLSGLEIQFGSSIWVVVAAVVVSSLTIFLSSIFTALRASKIPPMVAIRNNHEVKGIPEEKIKSSRLASKLFGIGGEIASRSLRRSRKKYRTTVISIVVSITLFISLAAFMQYSFGALTKSMDEQSENYNVSVYFMNDTGVENAQKKYESYRNMEGVISSEILFYGALSPKVDESQEEESVVYLQALGSEEFKHVVEQAGITYEKVKGKALYYNSPNGKNDEFSKGEILHFEELPKLTVADRITSLPEDIHFVYGQDDCLLVETSTIQDANVVSSQIFFMAENADKLEDDILEMDEDADVRNSDKDMRMVRAIRYVAAIFVYGFILVITLIGVTNIFNTITTNMKLRQKEFAMLRSVGMTDKEFKKMIHLESCMYGTKALLIGLPLGLVGNYLIYYAFSVLNSSIEMSYHIPFVEMVACVVCVFVLIRLIMAFSVAKTKKQNIIETIRNDNI